MTAGTLAARIAVRCHDAGYLEGPTAAAADYLAFLNDAVEDWNASGGFYPISDATTLQVADTYDYAIPALFAYVDEVGIESESVGHYHTVDFQFWYIDYRTGSTPTIHIRRSWFTPDATYHILIAGHKRLAVFATGDTVPPDLSAYLRERGLYHALHYLSAGGGSLAADRRAAAQFALQVSADMENKRSLAFRPNAQSQYVPGR
jgi:hypothetical protein